MAFHFLCQEKNFFPSGKRFPLTIHFGLALRHATNGNNVPLCLRFVLRFIGHEGGLILGRSHSTATTTRPANQSRA